MRRYRIITSSTIWEFDLDRMVYIRIPKNESLVHPLGGKPYEGKEIPFDNIITTQATPGGMQWFSVFNTGVPWGQGAVTESCALPNQDLSWIETLKENA